MSDRGREWYQAPSAPDPGEWWWAVEHRGHPAFYLRSLLAGDFGPGQLGPLPRHAVSLDGARPPAGRLRCDTCSREPDPADLEPVERATGDRGFLDQYRAGRQPWPAPTDPASCWLCSDPRAPANRAADVDGQTVRLCAGCHAHVERSRQRERGR